MNLSAGRHCRHAHVLLLSDLCSLLVALFTIMQGHLPTEHEPTISASMLASNDATPAPTTPLTHAIFLSTLIVPFALLPYIAITRRLRGLQSSATEIQHTTAAVQRELRATLLDNAVRKEEQARIRHAAEVTTAELKVLRERLERARAVQAAGETMVQELQRRIMQEREWRRCVAVPSMRSEVAHVS